MADFNTTCMHPASGYDYMEKGLTILITAVSTLRYDPISLGHHPDVNRHLWDADQYRATRRRFWVGWFNYLGTQIATVVALYLSFGLILMKPIRRRFSIVTEKKALIALLVIDSLVAAAGLIHYGTVYFLLSSISRMELNFFFALKEHFIIGWTISVVGYVLGRVGGKMGIDRVHRDGVRTGEIIEKKDLKRNALLVKIKETEKARGGADGGFNGVQGDNRKKSSGTWKGMAGRPRVSAGGGRGRNSLGGKSVTGARGGKRVGKDNGRDVSKERGRGGNATVDGRDENTWGGCLPCGGAA